MIDHDPALELKIARRGKWVAEFASNATLEELRVARHAGQQLIDALLAEKQRLYRDIHTATALRNSLAAGEHEPESSTFIA